MAQHICPQCGNHRVTYRSAGMWRTILFALGTFMVVLGVAGMSGDTLFALSFVVFGLGLTGYQVLAFWHESHNVLCQECGYMWKSEHSTNQ
jgi:predicted nucleic-acid-binding Zn-ribbon protein